MNVSIALSAFASNYTLTRYSATSYVNGTLSKASSSLGVKLAVMPLTGEEIMRIPEGNRTTSRFKVYSATQINSQDGQIQADEISINGDTYQVESCENWGFYWKAIVVKKGLT